MSKSNRVLDLYQALQNGQVINKKEAAEQFCVNEKSIQRDLDSIRDFLSEQSRQRAKDLSKVWSLTEPQTAIAW